MWTLSSVNFTGNSVLQLVKFANGKTGRWLTKPDDVQWIEVKIFKVNK